MAKTMKNCFVVLWNGLVASVWIQPQTLQWTRRWDLYLVVGSHSAAVDCSQVGSYDLRISGCIQNSTTGTHASVSFRYFLVLFVNFRYFLDLFGAIPICPRNTSLVRLWDINHNSDSIDHYCNHNSGVIICGINMDKPKFNPIQITHDYTDDLPSGKLT